MIKTWLVTGDTHGSVMERLNNIESNPQETGLIILGDAGLNFYLNSTDRKRKQVIQETGFTIFCVRGNHEERPENLGMELRQRHQEDYWGEFYWEDEFPNILYFANYGYYRLGKYNIFEIGGAYSVDKYYRLLNAQSSRWSGWFEDEQLTDDEMLNCEQIICDLSANLTLDFVFTHTCPIKWEPSDLFLSQVNQSTIDKSMELYLDEIEPLLQPYGIWLFGHYHADRLERPHVQQMYKAIEDLDDIYNRWYGNNPTFNDEYWIPKSPYFYENERK